MNLDLGARTRARRLLGAAAPTTAHGAGRQDDSLSPHTLQATRPAALDEVAVSRRKGPPIADLLAAGVQDITDRMVADSFKLNEVLRMILETMYRALGFRRIVFCLRDARTETLTGRFGLGDDAMAVAALFNVPLRVTPGGAPDLFTAVCLKGADTLIADATSAGIASCLPTWFTQQVAAPSFLLLPLTMKQAPFALIYADQAKAGGIELDAKELALLRTLRNQGVMAFRQAG